MDNMDIIKRFYNLNRKERKVLKVGFLIL